MRTVSRSDGQAVRSLLGTGALCLLSLSSLAAQTAPTSATIYNDGRVLVRRLLPVTLPAGASEQALPLGPVDPGTVFPLDPGVRFDGSSYDAAVDEQSVLRRAVGRSLRFRSGKDTVIATLVGVDPERYRMPDGTIGFARPGIPMYPADLVTLEPTLRVAVRSPEPRRDLRVGYFAQGGGWSASYQVVLSGAGMATVSGQAVIGGGPLRLRDVELQLLAGQVNTAPVPGGPRREVFAAAKVAMESDAATPAEEKVGEFHLYTLPGRATLEPGVVTTVALFEPAQARVRKRFEVQGQIPYWGGLPQQRDEDEMPVAVTYVVARTRKTDLGDRPLPGGVVRLFEPDSAGRLQLIGEAAIGHAPAGEDLRLAAGTAFDLTAKRAQTTYATRRDSLPGGWRTVATADYRVTLKNAGADAVTVDVYEQRGGEWSVVSSSVRPDKQSSTRTRFPVPVPAGGSAVLTYRVRVIW